MWSLKDSQSFCSGVRWYNKTRFTSSLTQTSGKHGLSWRSLTIQSHSPCVLQNNCVHAAARSVNGDWRLYAIWQILHESQRLSIARRASACRCLSVILSTSAALKPAERHSCPLTLQDASLVAASARFSRPRAYSEEAEGQAAGGAAAAAAEASAAGLARLAESASSINTFSATRAIEPRVRGHTRRECTPVAAGSTFQHTSTPRDPRRGDMVPRTSHMREGHSR